MSGGRIGYDAYVLVLEDERARLIEERAHLRALMRTNAGVIRRIARGMYGGEWLDVDRLAKALIDAAD